MKCTKCELELKENEYYCPMCGTKANGAVNVAEVSAPKGYLKAECIGFDKTSCPKCGATVMKGTRFCSNCGGKIIESIDPSNKVTKSKIKTSTVVITEIIGLLAFIIVPIIVIDRTVQGIMDAGLFSSRLDFGDFDVYFDFIDIWRSMFWIGIFIDIATSVYQASKGLFEDTKTAMYIKAVFVVITIFIFNAIYNDSTALIEFMYKAFYSA